MLDLVDLKIDMTDHEIPDLLLKICEKHLCLVCLLEEVAGIIPSVLSYRMYPSEVECWIK